MNAPFRSPGIDDNFSAELALDAAAEAAGIAENYARAAQAFASVGDIPAMNHAIRCASAAILSASQAALTLRPAQQSRR